MERQKGRLVRQERVWRNQRQADPHLQASGALGFCVGGNQDVDAPNNLTGFALSAQSNPALSQISTAFVLLEACKSALALINISTEYAGMSTAQELEAAITRAESELFA